MSVLEIEKSDQESKYADKKDENPSNFIKFKEFCVQKFAVISIAKQETGALYMGGKNYFVSIQDIVMSSLAYFIIFLTFVSALNTLGTIIG